MSASTDVQKSVEELFQAAVKYVQSLPADGDVKPSNETKLTFYGAFKQSTEGDVQGSRPSAFNFVARAKWDAWNALKGKSKEEAMKVYLAKLQELNPKAKL